MEIKIRCRACERTFPLAMAVDPEGRPGYCPLCGEGLAFQYIETFVETAEKVMAAGPEFLRHLTLLAELAGRYAIEPSSVLEPVAEAIDNQNAALKEPYRAGWPPRPSEPVG